MFWVSNYILQTCYKVFEVPANSCDICTHSLENFKTVSKNVPKQLRKTVSTMYLHRRPKIHFANTVCRNILVNNEYFNT